MKQTIALLLFVLIGCVSPIRPAPITPAEKCHEFLTALCHQGARCERYQGTTEEEYLTQCMRFMDGKIAFGFSETGVLDMRGQCDRVTAIGDTYEECMTIVGQTCEVPEYACNNSFRDFGVQP